MLPGLTSDQFWGGINRRFDRRLRRLYRMGYRLEVTEFGQFMVKRKYRYLNSVPHALTMYASNRDWNQALYRLIGDRNERKITCYH